MTYGDGVTLGMDLRGAQVARSAWRRRLAARRPLERAYRMGVGVLGALLLTAGLVMVPFPGPGWPTVMAGLFVLASEFVWAERLLRLTRRHVGRWSQWVRGQPLRMRLAVAGATALVVYGVVVLTLTVVGVPEWVPDWLPLLP